MSSNLKSRFAVVIFLGLVLQSPISSAADSISKDKGNNQSSDQNSDVESLETESVFSLNKKKLGNLSLSDFLRSQESFFEQSDSRALLKRKNNSAEISEKLEVNFDPWKVSNTTRTGTANYYDKFNSLQNTTTLKYETPQGLSAESFAKITEPIGSSSSLSSSDSVGASVNYEFNKTPKQYEYTETIAKTQKLATKLEIQGSYIDQLENFILNSISLYVQHCKLADKKNLEELVLQTLKIADAQLAAKSIDVQDHLRIKDLYLSFQREIQALEDAILQSERSLTSISANSAEYLKDMHSKNIDCETMLTEGKSIKAPDNRQNDLLIKQNSSIAVMRRKIDLARLQELAYKNRSKASLQWTAGIDVAGIRIPSQRTENLFIGLNYSYEIPEKLNKLKRLNLGREVQDLTIQMKLNEDSLRSKILQLSQSIKSLAGISEIVKQTHQNSLKSLQVLKIRQDLGIINANNVYSAYSNYASSLSAIRDLWQNYKTSILKLENLEKNASTSNQMQNSVQKVDDDE
jgi:hypothetical protein